MHAFVGTVVSMLPRAFMFLAAKVLTEEFVQHVMAKVVIAGLKYLVTLSKNTVDDELVAEIEKRINEQPKA